MRAQRAKTSATDKPGRIKTDKSSGSAKLSVHNGVAATFRLNCRTPEGALVAAAD